MNSTTVRAHQHVAGARRAPPAGGCSDKGAGRGPNQATGAGSPRHGRPGRLRRCRVRGRQGSRTPDGHRGVRLGRPSQAIVDPGLGFAKTRENDWTLLARVDAWAQLGRPVLVAASRKRFLGTLRADRDTGEPPSGTRPGCCHRGGIGAGRRPGRDMAMSVGGSVSAAASRRRLRVV
ncbi:dihydropteroate synthase [Streptomyces mirabilis]|uniref:dihydropteroate synthase n=1 Tax=Streptomyces mirabilis TaxID=68239 RepID=UPI0033AD2404